MSKVKQILAAGPLAVAALGAPAADPHNDVAFDRQFGRAIVQIVTQHDGLKKLDTKEIEAQMEIAIERAAKVIEERQGKPAGPGQQVVINNNGGGTVLVIDPAAKTFTTLPLKESYGVKMEVPKLKKPVVPYVSTTMTVKPMPEENMKNCLAAIERENATVSERYRNAFAPKASFKAKLEPIAPASAAHNKR